MEVTVELVCDIKAVMPKNLIGRSGVCLCMLQRLHYGGGGHLCPVYPCSGGGCGQSEEECPEDDRALSGAGGPASAAHEDPQNSV